MQNITKKIVIVGGGTAGWISAGTIAAKLRENNGDAIEICLVESPNIPIVGVGEGTWPTMRNTLKKMGIREADFIRECDVSFKQGAKFAQWATGEEDDYYYHPLILPEGFNDTNMAPYWNNTHSGMRFSETVCPQDFVCEAGLAPKQITTPEYASIANYAYHLNAGTFSDFLKKHCIEQLNVQHIIDDVVAVNSHESGDIASVSTAISGDIFGDLFIDCTGFKSLLLGGHYGIEFKSCKDVLFLDTALAVQVPYENEQSPIASHTLSTAQTAGWIWDIGLSTRRGVGHVYSSAYISEELAAEQLQAYVKTTASHVEDFTYRKIDINPGHREKFWYKNCVAIGLSAGFLEPLEASALVLVEMSAQMIAEQFPTTRQSMALISKRFNTTFQYRWARIIDFLKLHYILSQRTDSAFWIDNRKPETIPDSLKELMQLWQYEYPWHDDFDRAAEVFPAASYQYVLYGMGFKTEASGLYRGTEFEKKAKLYFEKNKHMTEKMLAALPSNRDLINKIKQYGLQRV